MPNEFPSPDPQNIWQNQPTEQFIMSADQLRYKAQQLQRRARVKTIFSIIMLIASGAIPGTELEGLKSALKIDYMVTGFVVCGWEVFQWALDFFGAR